MSMGDGGHEEEGVTDEEAGGTLADAAGMLLKH